MSSEPHITRLRSTLIACALTAFCVSLILPACEGAFGKESMRGWEAVGIALIMGFASVAKPMSGEGISFIFLGMAAVLNLLFFIALLALRITRGNAKVCTWLGAASGFAIIAGFTVPVFCLRDLGLSSGNFVWVLAHIALLAAIASVRWNA